MLKYYNKNQKLHKTNALNPDLKSILDAGFVSIGDCIFLDEALPKDFERSANHINKIKKDFLDFSGVENSYNKIHLDDYISQDLFIQSFLFLHFFKISWAKNFPNISCFIALGFQNDEVGQFATFSFYKQRDNEFVYDIENVNNYANSVYFELFNPLIPPPISRPAPKNHPATQSS